MRLAAWHFSGISDVDVRTHGLDNLVGVRSKAVCFTDTHLYVVRAKLLHTRQHILKQIALTPLESIRARRCTVCL